MTRTVMIAGLVAAAWMLPVEAHELHDLDKVVVLRCETELDGGIRVRNSSVTSATGVTIQRGDRCAAAVSSLLQAGLNIAHRSTTIFDISGEVSFNFVFLGGGSHDHDDDDHDDHHHDDD